MSERDGRVGFTALGACMHGCNRDPWEHEPGCSFEIAETQIAQLQREVERWERDFKSEEVVTALQAEKIDNLQAEVERLHARILDFLAAYKNSPNWDRLFGDVGALAAAIGFEDRQLAAHWERRLKQENEVAELRERLERLGKQTVQLDVATMKRNAKLFVALQRIAEAAATLKGSTITSEAEYHAAVERLLETIATEVKP